MIVDDRADFTVEQCCRIEMDTQNIGGRTGGNFQHKKNGAVLSVLFSLICSALSSYFEGNISANSSTAPKGHPMTRFKYSLLFAALLPVYAQADVSVLDDPKPQESTELPTITVTADRTASSKTATPFPARTPRSGCP